MADAPATWNDPDYKGIAAALKAADKVAVIAHVSPDGDAVGSALAMKNALESLGKDVVVIHNEGRPAHFNWLDKGEWLTELPDDFAERTALVVDTASADRVAAPGFATAKDVLVVDHHPTNPGFGRLNAVHPEYAAVSEMLPALLAELGVAVTPEIAACLFTGVYTDTGRMRYSNVTDHTRAVIAELGEVMGDGGERVREAIEDWPPSWVRYAELGVEHSRRELDGEMLVSALEVEDLIAAGVPHENIKDAQTIAISELQDLPASFHAQVYAYPEGGRAPRSVSLRSATDLDAGLVAIRFGGGGHKAAAGFVTSLAAEEILAQVLVAYLEVKAELEQAQSPPALDSLSASPAPADGFVGRSRIDF